MELTETRAILQEGVRLSDKLHEEADHARKYAYTEQTSILLQSIKDIESWFSMTDGHLYYSIEAGMRDIKALAMKAEAYTDECARFGLGHVSFEHQDTVRSYVMKIKQVNLMLREFHNTIEQTISKQNTTLNKQPSFSSEQSVEPPRPEEELVNDSLPPAAEAASPSSQASDDMWDWPAPAPDSSEAKTPEILEDSASPKDKGGRPQLHEDEKKKRVRIYRNYIEARGRGLSQVQFCDDYKREHGTRIDIKYLALCRKEFKKGQPSGASF